VGATVIEGLSSMNAIMRRLGEAYTKPGILGPEDAKNPRGRPHDIECEVLKAANPELWPYFRKLTNRVRMRERKRRGAS
jgi:hypothetical protein